MDGEKVWDWEAEDTHRDYPPYVFRPYYNETVYYLKAVGELSYSKLIESAYAAAHESMSESGGVGYQVAWSDDTGCLWQKAA